MTVREPFSMRRMNRMEGVARGVQYDSDIPPYIDISEMEEYNDIELSRAILRDNLHYYGRELLERDAYEMRTLLKKCRDLRVPIDDILNDTISEECEITWYASQLMSLSYMVGKFTEGHEDIVNPEDPDMCGYDPDYYYGGINPSGIPDDLGCELLRLMIEQGGDMCETDDYGDGILTNDPGRSENHVDSFMKREGNTKFWNVVRTIME